LLLGWLFAQIERLEWKMVILQSNSEAYDIDTHRVGSVFWRTGAHGLQSEIHPSLEADYSFGMALYWIFGKDNLSRVGWANVDVVCMYSRFFCWIIVQNTGNNFRKLCAGSHPEIQ